MIARRHGVVVAEVNAPMIAFGDITPNQLLTLVRWL